MSHRPSDLLVLITEELRTAMKELETLKLNIHPEGSRVAIRSSERVGAYTINI